MEVLQTKEEFISSIGYRGWSLSSAELNLHWRCSKSFRELQKQENRERADRIQRLNKPNNFILECLLKIYQIKINESMNKFNELCNTQKIVDSYNLAIYLLSDENTNTYKL